MMNDTTVIANLELWQAYRERDCQQARQQLVQKFARVVKYVAGRMAIGLPHYVEFNDLISAGLDFFGDRKKNALNQ